MIDCTCLQCGKAFKVQPSNFKQGAGKYCSGKCRGQAAKKTKNMICQYCGKSFETKACHIEIGWGKFCSNACKWASRHTMDIPLWKQRHLAKYSGLWQKQRRLVRKRDGNVCQICGRKRHKGERNFPIHHIQKLRYFGGNYELAHDLKNLITLCPECHPKAEDGLIPVPVRLL